VGVRVKWAMEGLATGLQPGKGRDKKGLSTRPLKTKKKKKKKKKKTSRGEQGYRSNAASENQN